ncbi:aspartate aminotransferase family protein [Rhodococcus sp. NPDC057529]|uniref:aspartate aminotransferase family protein n=1 Tax=Rhodococcus sp. NPDC057529 TaxID=3346158 RepID=UPI00366E314B
MPKQHLQCTATPIEAVSINTLGASDIASLDDSTRALIDRRRKVMGPAYRLSYSQPFQPARAMGTKIVDVHGDEFLDAYNNVVSVGHNHPRVVEAVSTQLGMINTNTRYLQSDIVDYAENLMTTHDDALGSVMFTCTGSEANDLALRIARHVTGGTGVIVSDYAYHGCTRDVSSWSPASGEGTALGSDVRTVAPPDTFRRGDADLDEWFLASVRHQVDDMQRHGIRLAAFVVDSLFSSDGIFPNPQTVLERVVDLVHDSGGLFVSDEVQSGFARTGDAMWGYQRNRIVPDLVTMGKPMGNGMPIGGVVAKHELMNEFGENVPYFNTFGGENVPIAAAQAVLDVIREEGLIANAAKMGGMLSEGMRHILDETGHAADVRGAGMYIGVEFVRDLDAKSPDPETARAVVNGMKDRRVLFSAAGPYANVLKIRPPLVFSESDVDRFLTAFDMVARTVTPK